MSGLYDLVNELTSPIYVEAVQPMLLRDFAQKMGWHPSDRLEVPRLHRIANAHLVVEHGLENTAVITFLKGDHGFSQLTMEERGDLLGISYNSLVDWHIHVSSRDAVFVYNRSSRAAVVEQQRLSPGNLDILTSAAFEQVTGRRPNPNHPALDDALIQTLSFWKRRLPGETEGAVSNEDLSAFLNAIMLVRAAEDHRRRMQFHHAAEQQPIQDNLLSLWRAREEGEKLGNLLVHSLGQFVQGAIPDYLISAARLANFDGVSVDTIHELLYDFYYNRFAPYSYDFSLISKHALSKIYEHYVSILRIEESGQAALPVFYSLPEEELEKAYGSVYTPQFVARFFARFLREQLPPRVFRQLVIIDPACGSGIFLRTILELQCDPVHDNVTTEFVTSAFANIHGFDIDENACQATRLSLALLHLVLTGRLPENLQIAAAETINHFEDNEGLKNAFDVVVANPPFVSFGAQSQEMRQRITSFMGELSHGRTDTYLAFLRIGLEMLRPGGYGLFVLPHSFLLGKSASGMRQLLADQAWIQCLADLSAIRVFEDAQTYVILLIFQKKPEGGSAPAPPALVVRCQDMVGQALQDALSGRRTQSSSYSIYDVEQSTFAQDTWLILPPTESKIRRKLERLPKLEEYLFIREGFVSGADSIYIVPQHQVPPGEEAIYVPFLPDREMRTYVVPENTAHRVFYPFIEGQKITENALKKDFPRTWKYLCAHRHNLENRLSSSEKNRAWWEPVRPRQPQNMMRPKIVTPHLALVPRFGVDLEGKYAVSHGPFMYPRDDDGEGELLRLFAAILNSTPCFWHISNQSHTYSRGYAMLEPKTLKSVPVPNPLSMPPMIRRRLIQLVDERLMASGTDTVRIEQEIDRIVSELYGLSSDEYEALTIGG